MSDEQMDWHRMFGLILVDFFTGTPYEVELERDMSLQQTFLDVVVIRKREGDLDRQLPDGLEDLARHNLITFKSHQEALADWALKELTGHYTNYRKQVSPAGGLLPEDQFRLFGVCARYPALLAKQVDLVESKPGVYRCERGTDTFSIIVSNLLPQEQRNAMLCLFSADAEQVRFGAEHFERHCPETSGLINRLFQTYKAEGMDMPYTMQDFRRELVAELTPEDLQELPSEKIQQIPKEKRLEGISAEELRRRLKELEEDRNDKPA